MQDGEAAKKKGKKPIRKRKEQVIKSPRANKSDDEKDEDFVPDEDNYGKKGAPNDRIQGGEKVSFDHKMFVNYYYIII